MSANPGAWRDHDYSTYELIMVELKVWDLATGGVVQSTAVYRDKQGEIVRRNLGAAMDTSPLIAEQTFPTIIWEAGKLICASWRELSHPKE